MVSHINCNVLILIFVIRHDSVCRRILYRICEVLHSGNMCV